MKNLNLLRKALLAFSFFGFLDAAYLTVTHFQHKIPPCAINGCESVLTSQYAVILGVPIALIGMLYYFVLFLFALSGRYHKFLFLVSAGFAISLGLLGIQMFAIRALCLYCLLSFGITTLLLFISLLLLRTWQHPGNSS